MKVSHLPSGMGACIGSAAAADLYGAIQHSGQHSLDLTLNGIFCAGQTLPAFVTAAIIAYIKPQIPHRFPFPLLPPVRCPQKTRSFPFDHKLEIKTL